MCDEARGQGTHADLDELEDLAHALVDSTDGGVHLHLAISGRNCGADDSARSVVHSAGQHRGALHQGDAGLDDMGRSDRLDRVGDRPAPHH